MVYLNPHVNDAIEAIESNPQCADMFWDDCARLMIEALLARFYDMCQTDGKMQMMLIPIMSLLKKQSAPNG